MELAKSFNGIHHASEGGRAHCDFTLGVKPVLSADDIAYSRDTFCEHCFPHGDLPKFNNGGPERARRMAAISTLKAISIDPPRHIDRKKFEAALDIAIETIYRSLEHDFASAVPRWDVSRE